MAAPWSALTTGGETRATPGVARTAASIPRSAAGAGRAGSLATMTSGALNPGPKPSAIVW